MVARKELHRKVYSALKCIIKCSESIRREEHGALKVLQVA